MATIALQIAGTALGSFLGGPFGGALGSALGGTLGSFVDRALLGNGQRPIQGPRLTNSTGISASEGAAIPKVYGRVRVGGQVIWATEFEEESVVEKTGTSGGKSAGQPATRTVRYTYFANVAIGLCEGPVSLVRRIWADGQELDLAGVTIRIYTGTGDQEPDPLIVAKQETADIPAFKGMAYVVFERLPLASYGNRLPQFAFEVVRAAPGLPEMIRAINIIPGSTEFGYAATEVREEFGLGSSQPINRAQWTHRTDWEASIDGMTALMPNIERATLISAWFGDDLRAAQCSFRPKVEKSAKATSGMQWSAAGLTRASAEAVSASDGRPNFGGSPADQSIVDAIRDLKARGLKVALHPFVLMDIPAANTKPDPWSGAAAQPAFPWRGRITCDPAPGRAGSPDGTAALASQIAALVGTTTAAHFTLAGDTVVYSGPAEWSFRRMVLHHAMLAKAAGGVDTFILASELVGLTHASAGNGQFPFVAAMTALLADLRGILGPSTIITYAADWSEYGAHVRNGGQEVRFPLDPFWAHAEVGAIGIDFYPPLSDWRDGRDHLDAAEAYCASDPAYLAVRIAAGEAFDWYYADDGARAAQIRSPITDGAYGKPWIYRAKDLKSWWNGPHIERVGGVELAQPTAYSGGRKPILLTEIGCPAVDKGSNQPNVFPDPKSIENALPYFSSGGRDDLVQWRVLEAYLSRFDPGHPAFQDADNPTSSHYAGRMIDPSFIAPWAYDARPFPVFPRQRSLWSDGDNWLRGHWLNGRIEAIPVERLIGMIAEDFGLPAPEAADVDAAVEGYVVDRPMSARAAIEPVAATFGLTATAPGDAIMIRGRPARSAAILSEADLVPAKDGTLIEVTRQQESELPRRISLGFVDGDNDFRQGVAVAETGIASSQREEMISTALHLPRGAARRHAEARLHDIRAARETFRFRLRRNALQFEPGDLVDVPTQAGLRTAMLTRITDGDVRECEARAYDVAFAENGPSIDELPVEAGVPALPGAAFVRLVEVPLARSAGLLSVAVRAAPWHGPYSVSSTENGAVSAAASVAVAARVGQTLTTLGPGPLWRWDHAASFDVLLEGGALSSLGEDAVLGGGNALAMIAPGGEIEVVLYRRAELVGERRYRVSGLLRGIGQSETSAARTLAPGAEVIILDDALVDLAVGAEAIGALRSYIILPAGRDLGDSTAVSISATPTGRSLRPLAPVHARARREAGGTRLTFIRRARKDADSLDLFEVPLGEDFEEYSLEILNGPALVRTLKLTTPDYLYPAATEIADFGNVQSSLAIRVRQVSGIVGPGDPLTAVVPVF
ncbi:MAG: protein transfer agent (GTA) orfg15 like [Beijerinckiaceae bacterium]|nr:MAG: protein transfer agent (GTA) orfg15 like [Beijerinckiaceae bacterium]